MKKKYRKRVKAERCRKTKDKEKDGRPVAAWMRDGLLFYQANARQRVTLISEVWKLCKMCLILPHI
ncbi:hypothetical protein D1645_23815 [Parabacteroides goldsteinii]|nr:hypothetical protein [Parabacteroides goldsteinii]